MTAQQSRDRKGAVAPPLSAAAASDIGLLRERNEDRYLCDPARGVFLVVDGVGGHAAGELAAETAVDVIRGSELTGGASICEAIARANNRIFELAGERPERRGMACVLTLAVVREGEIAIGHVGDSRLYLIWHGAMRKLTSDHSPVGEDEDAGALSEAEAMQHPRRNEVFRDVGSRPRAAADGDFIQTLQCRFRPDAALLLCSDGLTDHLTAAEVREIVDRYDGDAARVATELVDAANQAGGADNITALFVAGPEFHGGEVSGAVTRPRFGTTRASGTRPWPALAQAMGLRHRLVLLLCGVVIGMLVWMVVRR
jgi:serine/threonine protein phosphatase PrpC